MEMVGHQSDMTSIPNKCDIPQRVPKALFFGKVSVRSCPLFKKKCLNTNRIQIHRIKEVYYDLQKFSTVELFREMVTKKKKKSYADKTVKVFFFFYFLKFNLI